MKFKKYTIAVLALFVLAVCTPPQARATDVSVTAAEVLKTSTTVIIQGTLGATVTAGQTLYLDTTTSKYKAADANGASPLYTVAGIALNGGGDGQPVSIAVSGDIDPGFTVTVGTIYVLSETAGGIAPAADLTTGWRTVIIGIGTTASNLKIGIINSGVAVP
jgi:hypothetical protein